MAVPALVPLLVYTWLLPAAQAGSMTQAPPPPGPSAEPRSVSAAAPEEAAARRLDGIAVTGTRIARIEVEGPLPISVIEREELLRAGQPSLTDALRNLPWNSFGSRGEQPNSDIPNASLPQLRGLGSKYTLTLVDGQRLPGFATIQGGAAASVTGIPLGAVDRIEVLRDGASAIYGSDAIGGVINLITRREDTPPQFELHREVADDAGGDAWRASFSAGYGSERGHLLVALEEQQREPLLGAQRDYLIANAGSTFLANPGSYRRIDPATGDFVGAFLADPRCPASFDVDPVFPSSAQTSIGPSRFCSYRFRDLNMERAGFGAHSLFLSGRHDVGENMNVFARVLGIDGDGLTQSAPTPVPGQRLAADNPFNPTLGERGAGLGWPLVLLYRLTALGPRITEVDEQTSHLLAGLEGPLDWSDGGDWSLSVFHNRYDSRAEGVSGFALRDAFQAALNEARFDPFSATPGDPRGLEAAMIRPWSEGRSRAHGAELAFTLDTPFLFGGSLSHAFGIDLRRDEYAVNSDPATREGRVLGQGQAPAPEAASRNYGALYAEFFLPLPPRWELSLAARYDHYEDAGSRVSPKVALSFRPSDALLLRASSGRGFQAPDLVSAYGGFATGGLVLADPVECAERPQDPIACEPRFIEINIVPNPTLGPERARHLALGLVWQPDERFDVALDYVRTDIGGQIETLRATDALQAELACRRGQRSCDPLRDGDVARDAFGNIEVVRLPYVNLAGVHTAALDLDAGWRQPTTWGDFHLGLRASRVLEFERRLQPGQAARQLLDANGRPRWRGELRLDWDRGAHGASFGINHVAGYGFCEFARVGDGPRDPSCAVRVGSHSELGAQWRWQAPWRGRFSLGARNLRNRPPPFDPNGSYVYGLHDPNGRVWYLRYQQEF